MADTFYKSPEGTYVNTQFADKSLQGGPTYTISGNQITPIAPVVSTPNLASTPMSLTTLVNQPNQVKVPPQQAGGAINSLGGYIDSLIAPSIEQAGKEVTSAQTEKNATRSTLADIMGRITGIGQTRSDLENTYDIAGKTQKVTDYTNQLQTEQRALKNEQDRLS